MNEFAKHAQRLALAAGSLVGVGGEIAAVVGRGAQVTAKRNAPVDSGDLRKSIRLTRDGERAIVSTNVFYAPFQEFGTSTIAPDPFIGVAFYEWAPKLGREVERVRDEVVKKL